MKKILIALVVLVLVVVLSIVGLLAFGLSRIDDLIKIGIKQGGTYATGVNTQVDTVEVSLRKGTFNMSGFQLDNPPGFNTPHFLALGSTAVQLNAQATDMQTITLSSLTLSGIDLYLDKGGNPSNYNTILNNLKRFESGDTAPPADQSGQMRVIIESLVIEDVGVRLANMPGVSLLSSEVAVRVPRIELRNVGKEDPMSFGEVVGLVVKTVLAASIEAGGGIIPGDVLGDLTSGLSGLTSLSDLGIEAMGDLGKKINEQIGSATEQAKKAAEDLQKQADGVKDAAKDAADRMRGIFGGNKDDKP